jgi:hypothetical protein
MGSSHDRVQIVEGRTKSKAAVFLSQNIDEGFIYVITVGHVHVVSERCIVVFLFSRSRRVTVGRILG